MDPYSSYSFAAPGPMIQSYRASPSPVEIGDIFYQQPDIHQRMIILYYLFCKLPLEKASKDQFHPS